MKIENDWLNSEISCIKYEKKKKNKKSTDNVLVFKLVLMLSAVFFYAPAIEAKCNALKIPKKHQIQMNAGRNFVCPKCNTRQWQDNKNADWQGNFYCSSCKHNLGK